MQFWGSTYEHCGKSSLLSIRQQIDDSAKNKTYAFWAFPSSILSIAFSHRFSYSLDLQTNILHSNQIDYYFSVPGKLLTKSRFVVQIWNGFQIPELV